MKNESKNDKAKRLYECSEIKILLSNLGINDDSIIYRHPEPIDFEFYFNNKRIGLELTSLRPYTLKNRYPKRAVENIVRDVFLSELESEVSFFTINIILSSKAYKMGVDPIILHKEICDWKSGLKNTTFEYLDSVNIQYYPELRLPKQNVNFNFQYEGFLQNIPDKYVKRAYSDKQNKFDTIYKNYKKPIDSNGFDEIWLCIALPPEQKGYKICPIQIENSCFERVYLTQSCFPWPRIIELIG